MSEPLRVGNGAGFWGDNLDVPYLLARDGKLDVLTLEYLAELTMSILAHQKSKNAEGGFVRDFVDLVPRLVPIFRQQPVLKVITNGGGLNPLACVREAARALVEAGLGSVRIGAVWGDDVLSWLSVWDQENVDLSHMETGEPIRDRLGDFVSANAYLGAGPIAEALTQDARIVVTGRVADASLTLGPALHRFGWKSDDWDRLAAASVAGHLIECGAQVSGGLFEDWESVDGLANVGYPIAEIEQTGDSIITKADQTGGMISRATVAEQLVYEIDDPACYRTPDVNIDMTQVHLVEEASNRVRVSGAKGNPPSGFLKVSGVYRDGWTASGLIAVVGRKAEQKARAAGQIVLDRVSRAGFDLKESLTECLGAGAVVPGCFRPETEVQEVVLRITVRDPRRSAVERFCREISPLITSGPAGLAGYAAGRPEARPAFGYWPFLIPRSLVADRVLVQSAEEWLRPSPQEHLP